MLYGKKMKKVEEMEQPTLSKNCREDANCPPWGECINNKCICREELDSYYGVKCDNETLQLSVNKCYCVTFDNETNQLVNGKCIENTDNPYEEYLPLPMEINKLNEFMCEEKWNRTGRLCGKCLPGHSPLAYSYDMRCVKCPEGNRNVWKYILAAFGPLTIFYFLVLFLKINATSSHLHGYVIFCQIIASPAFARIMDEYILDHQQFKPIQVIVVMYSIWNLDFFRGLYPEICLDVSTLTVLALDYAVAIYPLLLTVISYFLIQLHARNVRIVVILWKPFRYIFTLLRRNWDSKTTVIDAYATFYILSFTKILCVSTDLLIPVRAYSLNNDSVTWVLYYDATVDYFGREHLPYAILAIACSLLITAPTILLLLVYQLKCFQRLLSCLKIRNQLLPAVMDSFQGCYKNGTEEGTRDYRWFAAVPLIGRVVLLFIYLMTLDGTVLPFIIIVILSIMVITTAIQPYKSRLSRYTKLDITFWGFLAAFYVANQGAIYGKLNVQQAIIGAALRIITGVFPLLYMICISAYWILSRMRKIKRFMLQIRARRSGYIDMESTLPDRLINHKNYHEKDLQDIPNNINPYTNDTY